MNSTILHSFDGATRDDVADVLGTVRVLEPTNELRMRHRAVRPTARHLIGTTTECHSVRSTEGGPQRLDVIDVARVRKANVT
jgi:hypothetical protein